MLSTKPPGIIRLQVYPEASKVHGTTKVTGILLDETESRRSTERRQMVENIWTGSIRPFFVVVVCSLLICPSIFQSYAAIAKYLREPKTVEVYMEDFTTQEAPWITICPSPQYNFPVMEKYVEEVYKGSPFYQTPLREALYGKAFSFRRILEVSSQLNMTLEEYMNSVATPTWANLWSCLITSGPKTDNPDWLPSSCEFNDELYVLGQLEEPNPVIIMENNEPMTFEAVNGTWESNFYVHNSDSLKICSTFRHKFENLPQVVFSLSFSHKGAKKYFITSNDKYHLDQHRDWLPTYDIFVTQPNEKLAIYQGMMKSPTFHFTMGDDVVLEVFAEKYKTLPTRDQTCLENPDELLHAYECATRCFEATFFTGDKGCRMPGYRNNSLFPAYPTIDACQDYDNYTYLTNRLTSSDYGTNRYHNEGTSEEDAAKQCLNHCSAKPCTKLQYTWKYAHFKPSDFDRPSRNYSDAWSQTPWGGRTFTNIQLIYRRSSARVFQETRAYDMWAFVGEIGGTWGLFLGLSFLQVITALENVGISVAQKLFDLLQVQPMRPPSPS